MFMLLFVRVCVCLVQDTHDAEPENDADDNIECVVPLENCRVFFVRIMHNS